MELWLYVLLLAVVACSRFDTCSGDGIPFLSFSVGHDRFTSGVNQRIEVTAGEVIKVCVRSGALDENGEMAVTVTADGDPNDFKRLSPVVILTSSKYCDDIVEVLTISREKDSSFEITATSAVPEGFVNVTIVVKATALQELLTTEFKSVKVKIDGITEQMSKKFQQLNATCSQRDQGPRCDLDVVTACNGYNATLQTICTSLEMSDCTDDVTEKVSDLKKSLCSSAGKGDGCSLSSATSQISTQLGNLRTVTVALQNKTDQLNKLCTHICNDNNLLNDKNLTMECKCTRDTESPTTEPTTESPTTDTGVVTAPTKGNKDPAQTSDDADPSSNKTLIIGVVGFIVFVITLVAVYALYHNRSKVTACLDASPPKAGGSGGGGHSGRNRRYQELPQTMEAALYAE